MGWSIGYDTNWGRGIGYSVPAICDHPKCNKKIDRGLAYVCGGGAYGGDKGCGLYFCSKHLYFGRSEDAPQLCKRCMQYKKPYTPKPDTREWIEWKLNDKSWEEWRKENPKEVKQMRVLINKEV